MSPIRSSTGSRTNPFAAASGKPCGCLGAGNGVATVMRNGTMTSAPTAAMIDEYENVRSHPTRFLVKRGHDIPEVEEVVRQRRRYAIVDKVDRVAAAISRRLNPRASRTTARRGTHRSARAPAPSAIASMA